MLSFWDCVCVETNTGDPKHFSEPLVAVEMHMLVKFIPGLCLKVIRSSLDASVYASLAWNGGVNLQMCSSFTENRLNKPEGNDLRRIARCKLMEGVL